MKKQTIRLALILGIGALTGPVAIASLAGLFKIQNAPMIAIAFMAGPGAIITSALADGNLKERFFSAIIAGIIATIMVSLSAVIGPKILEIFNINVIKIFGGISVIAIALLIMGIKIPEKSPIFIIIIGIILGFALK